jgi:hypothetical protein
LQSTFAASSAETIVAFHHFHPLVERLTLFLGDNFHSEMDLVLNRKILTHFLCFLSGGLLGVPYRRAHFTPILIILGVL